MTPGRVTYLNDLMDSAYDAKAIRMASERRNHNPVIHFHTRPKPTTQLPSRVKPQPEWDPAGKNRYKTGTMVERGFSPLKDEFLSSQIRVRGSKKVMAQLLFGVLALTVVQLLRMHR